MIGKGAIVAQLSRHLPILVQVVQVRHGFDQSKAICPLGDCTLEQRGEAFPSGARLIKVGQQAVQGFMVIADHLFKPVGQSRVGHLMARKD